MKVLLNDSKDAIDVHKNFTKKRESYEDENHNSPHLGPQPSFKMNPPLDSIELEVLKEEVVPIMELEHEMRDEYENQYHKIKEMRGEKPDEPGRETEQINKMIDEYKEQLMTRKTHNDDID